jgi:hypothetical protein
VVALDANEIAARIHWYFALDPDARSQLSQRCREAVAGYTEEAAAAQYRETFAALCRDLAVDA